jgi:hypothetical protein
MRATIEVIGILLITASTATAQTPPAPTLNLRVSSVNGDQVIVTDTTTGVQTTVKAGDVIQGWTVVAITPRAVEIEREEPEQGQRIRTQLPVGLGGLRTPSP